MQSVPKPWATWYHIAWHEELLLGKRADLFLCNDHKLYKNDCPSGEYLCPASGKPGCAYDDNKYVYVFGEQPTYQTPYYQNPYDQILSELSESLKKEAATPSPSIQYQPSQFEIQVEDYFNKLAAMKAMLLEEYKAAGGFWTDSQLEYNATQKLKEMGIKLPTSPYGSYISPNYSSTKCNSLNGGLDCYGSNGSRTQVIPMGSGQYEIRSY